MKVTANRDCSILGKGYQEGKTYTVPDGEGQMLIKNGFKESKAKKRR